MALWIHAMTLEGFSSRFPHSDIPGSSDICSSPKLFAAYHVFHRLLVPRHPPCALSCLTFSGFFTASAASLRLTYSVTSFAFLGLLSHIFRCASDVLIFFLNIRFFQYAVFKVHLRCTQKLALSIHPMEMERFELLTPCLQGRCSPN